MSPTSKPTNNPSFPIEKLNEFGSWSRSIPTIDPWLTAQNSSVTFKLLYEECFSGVFTSRSSRKQKSTFNTIVSNLLKTRAEICCPTDKRTWRDHHPYPEDFGVSTIGTCVKVLEKHGYLTSERHYGNSKAKHPVTYITPTKRLLEAFPQQLKLKTGKEGIIRCKGFKRPTNYLDNPWVAQRYYAAIDYNDLIKETPEHQIYSVFVNDFSSMGRFAGSKVMMMPKLDRMNMTIDGERVFEVDIKSCLPWIALAKTNGIKLGSDFYDIEGFPRDLIKAATVRALHCISRRHAQRALQGWINGDPDGRPFSGYKVAKVFDAIEGKIPNHEKILYKNRGLEFMADESLRMSLFLNRMSQLGIKTFPIHDAVMGKISDKDIILDSFLESFQVNGIQPSIKVLVSPEASCSKMN